MKLYELTIVLRSGLGTPLKGDSIFGHFCWQVAHDPTLVEGGLENLREAYSTRPFVIFSSAFPSLTDSDGNTRYSFKRPDLPLWYFPSLKVADRSERIRSRKDFKKKKWMLVDSSLVLDLSHAEYLDDHELLREASCRGDRSFSGLILSESDKFVKSFSQSHNTINRLSGTTGPGEFAPYEQDVSYYFPGTSLVILVLIDEECTDIQRVHAALAAMGKYGFGKDASIGLGRFSVVNHAELTRPVVSEANSCYSLSPCVPERDFYSEAYFVPFCRFGKHGDRLARSRNPFKNPVIMADEGAVFFPRDATAFEKPYLGRPVTSISKILPETFAQGYSVYLPLAVELQE